MDLLTYEVADGVATVTMDDGKVNVLSPAMQSELHAALDQAEADGAVVLLRGRPNAFSAGFDLPLLQSGAPEGRDMVKGGFLLSDHVLSLKVPVVAACQGHAIAMGLFLLLSADYTVGATGTYRLLANEVAIGLILPYAAIEVVRQRLTPAAAMRMISLSEQFSPESALGSGIFDRVVAPEELDQAAREVAVSFTSLDLNAHAITKARAREPVVAGLREAIARDFD